MQVIDWFKKKKTVKIAETTPIMIKMLFFFIREAFAILLMFSFMNQWTGYS